MKIRNILTHAFRVAAKHKQIFFVFSFVYAVMLFAALFLGALGGLTLVLVIFIFLPMQLSFYLIAKKMQELKPIEPNDIYLGFKSFLTAIALGSKMMFRGFLNAIIWFIISLLVGGIALSYYLMNNIPTLIEFILANSNDLEAIMIKLDSYPQVVTLVLVIYAAAVFIAGLIYINDASKNSIAPFILFEAPFDLNSSIRLSRKVNKLKQNKLYGLYLIFFLMLILIIGVTLFLSEYLFNIGVISDLVLVAMILMMVALLFAPLNLMFVIVKSSYYHLFGKTEVYQLIEEIKQGLKSNPTDSK